RIRNIELAGHGAWHRGQLRAAGSVRREQERADAAVQRAVEAGGAGEADVLGDEDPLARRRRRRGIGAERVVDRIGASHRRIEDEADAPEHDLVARDYGAVGEPTLEPEDEFRATRQRRGTRQRSVSGPEEVLARERAREGLRGGRVSREKEAPSAAQFQRVQRTAELQRDTGLVLVPHREPVGWGRRTTSLASLGLRGRGGR